MELECVTLLVWMCSPAWKLSKAMLLGFYEGFLMQLWLIINSMSILSGGCKGRQNFQASNHGLVFLVTNLNPEPTQSHLKGTKDVPRALIMGIYQGFMSPVSGMGSKTNIRTRDLPSTLNSQTISRVLGGLCQEQGAETNIYILQCLL